MPACYENYELHIKGHMIQILLQECIGVLILGSLYAFTKELGTRHSNNEREK